MLRVNLSDGTTLRLDLEHPDDRGEWQRLVGQESFQQSIRGAAIQRDGTCHVMPLPQKFNGKPMYEAELIWDSVRDRLAAERITCYIDTIKIDLTVYVNGSPPMARVDLTRVGRRRHAPALSVSPVASSRLNGARREDAVRTAGTINAPTVSMKER